MFRVFCLGIGILILLIGASFESFASLKSVLNSTELTVSEPVPVPSEPAVGGASLKVTGGIMTLKNSQNVSGQVGLTAGPSGVNIGVSGISATVNATASDAYLVTQKAVFEYIKSREAFLLNDMTQKLDALKLDTTQKLALKLDTIVGMIAPFGAETPPAGWLECNGASVARATYPALYDIIKVSFGQGASPGSTFALPDLQGRAPIGAGTGSGLTARTLAQKLGQESVSRALALNQIPSHTHPYDDIYLAESGGSVSITENKGSKGGIDNDNAGYEKARTTGATGGDANAATVPFTTETMQPSLVVKYYIRALP